MDTESIIEQIEIMIGLVEQDGKDYIDERDVPMLKQIVELLKETRLL